MIELLTAIEDRCAAPIARCGVLLREAKALGYVIDSEKMDSFAWLEITAEGRKYLRRFECQTT